MEYIVSVKKCFFTFQLCRQLFYFLYSLFIGIYPIAVQLLSYFKPKAKLWIEGRKQIFQHIEKALKPNEQRIWIHCASVGEFEQARPIIESLKQQQPNFKIVVSFFSPSGYELRKNYPLADYVFYLPMDGRSNAQNWVNLIAPEFVIFVKYEFWYHYLTTLKRKGIPTYLIAAVFRPSQAFFKSYGVFFRNILKSFEWIMVHDEQSKQLLSSIRINNVTIAGDTRYDRVADIAVAAASFPKIDQFKNKFQLIVAGSTWTDDENILKNTLPILPPNWKIMLAPHELDAKHLQQLSNLWGNDAVFYTEATEQQLLDKKVLIVDTMGMLSAMYRYGNIAYVGGGFLKGGIHNTLEPAVFGLPVFFGPTYEKFVEAVALVEKGFAFPIQDHKTFQNRLINLIENPAQLAQTSSEIILYMKGQTGATELIMDFLKARHFNK